MFGCFYHLVQGSFFTTSPLNSIQTAASRLVFIGAGGIAVRAIAPYVRDKMTDPPVVAADEAGHFCIPLLSGHVGGANELAERMAGWLNGIPVITTATDVNGVFAVDVFPNL